jgi:hypothetical protein
MAPLDILIAENPCFHVWGNGTPVNWSASPDVLRFIVREVRPGMNTLETPSPAMGARPTHVDRKSGHWSAAGELLWGLALGVMFPLVHHQLHAGLEDRDGLGAGGGPEAAGRRLLSRP